MNGMSKEYCLLQGLECIKDEPKWFSVVTYKIFSLLLTKNFFFITMAQLNMWVKTKNRIKT